MLRRHIILPILATLILTISLSFLSCASQERNDAENESEWTDSEEVADNDAADDSASADESLGEETASNEEAPAANSEDTLSELESTVSEEKAEETTAEAAPEAAPAPTETATNEAAEENLESLEPNEDLTPRPEETAAAQPPAEGQADDLSAEDLGGEAGTETAEAAPPAPSAEEAPGTVPEVAAFDSTPAPAPELDTASTPPSPRPRRARRSARASVPTIPEKSFEKLGYNLNRFYFLRNGDTRESVSELIYGNQKNAGELGRVNKGRPWKAGTLIYYVSPIEPKDRAMHSFYQERNVPPSDVTVGRGDWLSSIAKAKLGSPDSWKEIAVVNGLDSPDSISVGKRLAVYPKDLRPYSNEALAQAQKSKEQEVAESAPPPPPKPVEAVAPPPPPAPVAPPPPPAPPVTAKKDSSKPDALNIGKLIEQNLFAVAVGGVILLLGIALMALNKKKSRRDDFGEDGFSAPPKVRRK